MEWIELLFWLPTSVDLLLLIFTYSSCRLYGSKWYFEQLPDEGVKSPAAMKEKVDYSVENYRIDQVWQLAMAAYSAYACLLPLAFYWCYYMPELRVNFCVAMTALMFLKLDGLSKTPASALKDSKNLSLLAFYLPTYGGYVLVKIFQ